MRTILLIFLFGILYNTGFSQSQASIFDTRNIFDEKGDFYYDKGDHKKAIVYYNMAYKADANNYYSVLKKAEAYSAMGLTEHATECYQIIFETNLFVPNEYRLKLAKILLKSKDIKGYEKWMAEYNKIVNTEISGYISSTEVRAKMYKDSSFVIVENESILNTEESEVCPAVHNNKVVFASTRKNLDGSKANNYFNLYAANYVESGKLGKLNKFNKNLDTKQNESSPFFLGSTNQLYFTRSTSTDYDFQTFVSEIPNSVGSPLNINEFKIDGLSIGQPTFNSKGTKVYFVSEASGGSGGLDIYTSELVNGKWSTPKNLGPKINTSRDEMYPFVLHDTLLYFTSNGHKGIGGHDLYSVSLRQENATPKNLGNKVNSKYDDFALSFTPEGLTGYFCSNRPGGFGEEDIYRLQLIDLKVKYAAYRHKKRSSMEKDKINLYLENGEEYNITSSGSQGFDFSFVPQEDYKMVIQQENVLANNVINNSNLTAAQRKKEFLNPQPLEKSEIKLQAGMKYQYTAGMQPISSNFKQALENMSKEYSNTSGSTIDLTALAKELQLRDGEVYTIRFVKDDNQPATAKSKEESSLHINGETVSTSGNSFFIVLPLDIEANFNIKTDIAHFKDNFNPKKVGGVKVDAAPVIPEKVVAETKGFPILVNTESFGDITDRTRISAQELTIVPGTMYILTLSKTGANAGKYPEIVIPLTKGVKYNLGTEAQSLNEFNKAVSQMKSGQGTTDDEELIDISVLSKELDIMSQKDIVFNLVPATKIAAQSAAARNVVTTLDVDGRKFYVTDRQKMQINLKLDQTKKVNIQTDLGYVKENFDASTVKLNVDTKSINDEIITDPVFDVIIVNFDLDKYDIRPDAKNVLDSKVVNELKADTRLYVTIKGYTDGLGDADHNKKLSGDRARAVKSYLASMGIGENRIRTFSFGESMELKEGIKWEDLSESELQKHRKVEIVIYIPEKK